MYYHGKQGVLKNLSIVTAPSATSNAKTVVLINTEAETGHTFVCKNAKSVDTLPEVTYGTALEGWTTVKSGTEVVVADGDALVVVCEVDADNKPVGMAYAKINVA